MKYPFDIEEIFPGAGSVRLPRQQSGSSAQGLTLTLMADYTLRTGAWLPSSAIVALLAEAGVSNAGARTAISRLWRRGVLDNGRLGRNSSYRLTAPIALELAVGGAWIASYGSETWDGQWTLIAFSLPQDAVMQRRALRTKLRWLGCAPLYDALWISPLDLTGRLEELAEVDLKAVTVFRARHIDLAAGGRNPIDAWEISAIAEQYEAFIKYWSTELPRVRAGELTGAEAVAARTRIMDTYRRFCTIDPQLPAPLLSAEWPRQRARNMFTAVYDGLAATAEQHVRTVAARYAAAPQPDIHANTVADLLAGEPPWACHPSPG